MPVAIITGASRGLGFALADALATRGWRLVIDARDGLGLERAARHLGASTTAVAGDVTHAAHREELASIIAAEGRLDLLVNNASTLGPSPLPPLPELSSDAFEALLRTNVVAPLALLAAVIEPLLAAKGVVIQVSSDAAVEAYPGWGGYGASKAALDQVSAVLASELPTLAIYAVDPGDMRTSMQQAAFPGEDIRDRPEPATVVPALLRLVEQRPPSGRYRASDLLGATPAAT